MPVAALQVRDFSAFESAKLEFARGINVFVGLNGTGKTHLLKLIYASLETLRRDPNGHFAAKMQDKLAGVFRPDDDDVGRLVRRIQGKKTAQVRVTIVESAQRRSVERVLSYKIQPGRGVREVRDVKGGRFTIVNGRLAPHPDRLQEAPIKRSIFLPTREVLAMYEGFADAYREKQLSFDETYFDTVLALSASPLRGTSLTHAALAKRLRSALGGHVELKGPRFYVKFDGDNKARTEAHLVAEGLRKIASLERLVLNGTLRSNGYLFWDEPEANLNPRLVAEIADILGMLANDGIQIFLSTHDYLLARRLSLATKLPGCPPTRFFGFARSGKGPVEATAVDRLEELEHNPMVDEFQKLYTLSLEVEFGK